MMRSIMKSTLKILSFASGLALLMSAVTAGAHAHLHSAIPADGSVITSAPSNIVLNFSEPARLTVAWLRKDSEPKRKLEPLPTQPAQQVSIPVPHLTPGRYEVDWRVLSDDGHVMAGALHFTLSQEAAASQPTHP
jgi:methionine-rich copper-binding protein CopC